MHTIIHWSFDTPEILSYYLTPPAVENGPHTSGPGDILFIVMWCLG